MSASALVYLAVVSATLLSAFHLKCADWTLNIGWRRGYLKSGLWHGMLLGLVGLLTVLNLPRRPQPTRAIGYDIKTRTAGPSLVWFWLCVVTCFSAVGLFYGVAAHAILSQSPLSAYYIWLLAAAVLIVAGALCYQYACPPLNWIPPLDDYDEYPDYPEFAAQLKFNYEHYRRWRKHEIARKCFAWVSGLAGGAGLCSLLCLGAEGTVDLKPWGMALLALAIVLAGSAVYLFVVARNARIEAEQYSAAHAHEDPEWHPMIPPKLRLRILDLQREAKALDTQHENVFGLFLLCRYLAPVLGVIALISVVARLGPLQGWSGCVLMGAAAAALLWSKQLGDRLKQLNAAVKEIDLKIVKEQKEALRYVEVIDAQGAESNDPQDADIIGYEQPLLDKAFDQEPAGEGLKRRDIFLDAIVDQVVASPPEAFADAAELEPGMPADSEHRPSRASYTLPVPNPRFVKLTHAAYACVGISVVLALGAIHALLGGLYVDLSGMVLTVAVLLFGLGLVLSNIAAGMLPYLHDSAAGQSKLDGRAAPSALAAVPVSATVDQSPEQATAHAEAYPRAALEAEWAALERNLAIRRRTAGALIYPPLVLILGSALSLLSGASDKDWMLVPALVIGAIALPLGMILKLRDSKLEAREGECRWQLAEGELEQQAESARIHAERCERSIAGRKRLAVMSSIIAGVAAARLVLHSLQVTALPDITARNITMLFAVLGGAGCIGLIISVIVLRQQYQRWMSQVYAAAEAELRQQYEQVSKLREGAEIHDDYGSYSVRYRPRAYSKQEISEWVNAELHDIFAVDAIWRGLDLARSLAYTLFWFLLGLIFTFSPDNEPSWLDGLRFAMAITLTLSVLLGLATYWRARVTAE